MSDPCPDCGKVHPVCPDCGKVHPHKVMKLPPHMKNLAAMFGGVPGQMLLLPPHATRRQNPKTAFLREPMFTKSRPLTAAELKVRWVSDGKRAHHRACRRLAAPVPFLDYVSCSKCNVALNDTNGNGFAEFVDGNNTFVAVSSLCANDRDPGPGCPWSLTCPRRPVGGTPPPICDACEDVAPGDTTCGGSATITCP